MFLDDRATPSDDRSGNFIALHRNAEVVFRGGLLRELLHQSVRSENEAAN